MTGFRIQAHLPIGWVDIARRDTCIQATTLANSMTARTGYSYRVVPEAPAIPPASASSVLTGNADLEQGCTWSPPTASPERSTLPGHEHEAALRTICPWFTDRRAFALALVLGLAGTVLGALDFTDRAALFVAAHQEVRQ